MFGAVSRGKEVCFGFPVRESLGGALWLLSSVVLGWLFHPKGTGEGLARSYNCWREQGKGFINPILCRQNLESFKWR